MHRLFRSDNFRYSIPLVVGVLAFFWVMGPRVLDPTNIGWLGKGDPATHYLGWAFFRSSDWAFPLGLNPDFGLELGNSIVFSDSNPLLAIIFKAFSALLPQPFQYFGFWILLCFVLQAFFAWKLMGIITDDIFIRALGCVLFVFSPPMLWRLHGHLSLVGHFFILAALYLSLRSRDRFSHFFWVGLLVAAAAVHAYLLGMVATVWLADLFGRGVSRERLFKCLLIEFVLGGALVGLTCWQVGYFSVGEGVSTGGFGYFRLNALSLFSPGYSSEHWSYFLQNVASGTGDYEGFNYLGAGVIALFIFSVPALVKNYSFLIAKIKKRPVLLVAMIGLTVFSLSNIIAVGEYEFSYAVPDALLRFANVFRASGRMFWPVFYLLVFVIIYFFVRLHDRSTNVICLMIVLVVQVVDTHAGWSNFRSRYMVKSSSEWPSTLESPFWKEAGNHYKKLKFIQPQNNPPHWQELASYASHYGMSTDAVYLARVNSQSIVVSQVQANAALEQGRFDSDSLYVLQKDAVFKAALNMNSSDDLLADVNGYYVMAPGWNKCKTCSVHPNEVNLLDLSQPFRSGEVLSFSMVGNANKYLAHGWSASESWGTWSSGNSATLVLPVSDAKRLIFDALPYLIGSHDRQTIELKVNDIPALVHTFRPEEVNPLVLDISEEIRASMRKTKLMRIKFFLPDAVRPIDVGGGEDVRTIALGLKNITIE